MAAFVRKAPTIEWKKENIYGLMKEIMDEQGVKVLHLAIPLRVLVTGAEKTPSIDATLELYGQERVLTRLNEGMEKWALREPETNFIFRMRFFADRVDKIKKCPVISHFFRGYSSAGRALAWHARGQRFDPAYLHQDFRSLVF